MAEARVHIGATGALLLAILLFLTEPPFLCALIAAAAIHEIGHISALRLCGARVIQLRLDSFGLCLISTALCRRSEEIFCTLAGPVTGLIWATAVASFYPLCAGLSLLLSLYNLLPALPLDGGRALMSLTGSRVLLKITGSICAAALLLLALWAPLPVLMFPALQLWLESVKA